MKKLIWGLFFGFCYLLVAPVAAFVCAIIYFPYVVKKGGEVKFSCRYEQDEK